MKRRINPMLLCLSFACIALLTGLVDGQNARVPASVLAKHQKLYSDDYHTGRNINSLTRAGKDVDIGAGPEPPLIGTTEEAEKAAPSYPDPQLLSIACDADAVIIAMPISSETGLTEDQDFLYTDYRFRVESVLKNSSTSSLSSGSEIIVTRPGGDMMLSGRRVKAEALDFPLFKLQGRYLLFLRYLPETGTYRAYRSGTFTVPHHQPASPVDRKLPLETKNLHNEDTFLTEVRAAVTAPCGPGLIRPGLY